MQTAADLRSHYDAVRARLWGRVPSPVGTPIVPVAVAVAKPERPPIICPVRLRRYPHPIGPTRPIRQGPSLKSIIYAVCCEYGVDPRDMTGPRRLKEYVFARQVAYYIARKITSLSLPQIGIGFGGKDHTTVLHGVHRIEALAAEDPALKSRIDSIIRAVGARS